MRKNMRYRLLLMLVLLSLAAGIHAQNIPSGVVINKTVTADATVPFKYNVTTEAYVTGDVTGDVTSDYKPADIVIMIDNSYKVANEYECTYQWNYIQSTAKNIVQWVFEHSPNENGKFHRISIVQCNGEFNGSFIGDHEYYVDKYQDTQNGKYFYLVENSDYEGSTVVKRFLATNSSNDVTTLKNKINELQCSCCYDGSYLEYGFRIAEQLFTYQLGDSRSNDYEYEKIIVLLTGSFPGTKGYDEDSANSAKSIASNIKATGVKIYCVGFYVYVDKKVNTDTGENQQFLNSISSSGSYINSAGTTTSEFPGLLSTNSTTTYSDSPTYAIWDQNKQSVDMINPNFQSPVNDDVHVFTADVTDQSGDVYNFGDPSPISATASIQNGSVSVSGYDLSTNYVGNHTSESSTALGGSKLIITYPLYFDASKSTSAAIPTSSSSGLYEGDSPLFTYSSPSITIPTLVISREGLNVGESATFTVYKVIGDNETAVGQVVTTCTSKDAAATATLKVPETGTYRVRETTWGYSSSSGTDYVDKTCNSSSTFTYSFTGTKKANDAHHSEAQKTFSFN